MKSQPVKKRVKKDTSSAGGLIINAECFKDGRLYRVKLRPGAKPKILSDDEAVVTIKEGKAVVDIRIRCGCSDPPGAGCRIFIHERWITCAPTVCQSCDMAISSRQISWL